MNSTELQAYVDQLTAVLQVALDQFDKPQDPPISYGPDMTVVRESLQRAVSCAKNCLDTQKAVEVAAETAAAEEAAKTPEVQAPVQAEGSVDAASAPEVPQA